MQKRKSLKPIAIFSALLLFVQMILVPSAGYGQVIPVTFTPALMSSMNPPTPVEGCDGKFYLVYELMLANSSSLPTNITKLEVVDGTNRSKVLKNLEGVSLKESITILGSSQTTDELKPAQAAIVWFELAFDKASDIPDLLAHRMSCQPNVPDKLGYPLVDKVIISESDNLKVDKSRVTNINSPLEGNGWTVIGGIGSSRGHRRAMLALNNELYLSQRFANDWMQLDENGKACTGDPKKVESYPGYGKRVLAVSDGTVVEAFDTLENQIPGPPGRLPVSQIGGNYVILDLGNNKYAFYAHLKPGSVKVHAGDKVKSGQQIAELGNTGNTTAPHLHFHLCDKPSPLAANGLPFVLNKMNVTGRYSSEDDFFTATDNSRTVKTVTTGNGVHDMQMPLAGTILSF